MTLLVAVVGLLLAVWPVAPAGDRALYDLGLRRLASARPAEADEQVLVALDQASLDAIEAPLALLHEDLARFLLAMVDAGARAVMIDLILPERSYDGIAPGHDATLTAALLRLRRAGVLVLARTVDEQGAPRAIHPPFIAVAGPDGSGYALFRTDPDGVVRRFEEHLGSEGARVDTFVGVLARRLGLPVHEGGIDYTLNTPLPQVPLWQVLDWSRQGRLDELTRSFRGRIVWLGAVLPFTDRHRTPLDIDGSTTPGVAIHAQALRTLRDGRWIRPLPAWGVAAAGAAAGAAFAVSGTVIAAALATAAVLAVTLGGGWWLLGLGWAAPAATLAVVGVGAALVRLTLETAREILARRRLRRAFAGYVSPAVMKELEAGHLEGMASTRRHLCVLFMDVRGFTLRSEQQAPEQVIAVLNRLFELATAAIHRQDGTVKEFMGDGVMALFGAPGRLDQPEQAAFDAAQEIFATLPALNAALVAEGHAPLAIGMGLASGEAVVGHIGAASRHAYGALGDCVNVASRLEGLTKEQGWPLLVSQAVRDRLQQQADLVDLGTLAIKGHSAARVFAWRP